LLVHFVVALRGGRGNLFGHCISGRRQRLLHRGRVPHRAALRSDRHDRTGTAAAAASRRGHSGAVFASAIG